MLWEHTEGVPHVVVTKTAQAVRTVEFYGPDGRERAHQYAEKQVARRHDTYAMVCVRVRQLGNLRLAAINP